MRRSSNFSLSPKGGVLNSISTIKDIGRWGFCKQLGTGVPDQILRFLRRRVSAATVSSGIRPCLSGRNIQQEIGAAGAAASELLQQGLVGPRLVAGTQNQSLPIGSQTSPGM